MMEVFCENIINGLKLLTIFGKKSTIIDIQLRSEYTSALVPQRTLNLYVFFDMITLFRNTAIFAQF